MNCIIISPLPKSRKQIEKVISENKFLNILTSVEHIDQAKALLLDHKKIDVVFIDIEQPGMDGWGLLDKLPGGTPAKVFLSTQKELAKEAFDYDGADFILLPVTPAKLLKALGKITKANKNILSSRTNQNFIFLKTDRMLHKVEIKDILYAEGLADYVSIYVANKRYVIHSTLKGLLSKLPEDDFIRVHKSFIVNLNNIKEIQAKAILIDNISIPLSRNYKDELIRKINYLKS